MSAFLILKFIHVLLAITALGANITYGIWSSLAARQPAHLGFAMKGIKVLDDRIANPSYGLLLLTGLAMLYVSPYSWRTPWILTALILYVVMIGIAATMYSPLLRRQLETLEAQGPNSSAYRALASRSRSIGIFITVLVVIIVFLMVTKPVLWQ